MRYISTKSNDSPVSLVEAVNRCMAPDGGIYMPEVIPTIPRALFNNIGEMNLREIAYVVASSFFANDIPGNVLKTMVDESFAFDAPLVAMPDNVFVLELFNGPTLTFKDYGARFMARLMKYLDGREKDTARTILVATTGNTGAAAANGFYHLNGIKVCVLYPKGYLNSTQTSMFTGLGENIHPIEVAGSVEDCKRLVTMAMADESLSHLRLTGANSINIARLIPQITFAMYAYSRLQALGVTDADKAVYSMPCGNLSNLVGTAMAKRMGLPIGGIIGATNSNNQLCRLMDGGDDTPQKVQPLRTFAPSIDMSYPSGWPRLKHLYNGDLAAMRADIKAAAPVANDVIAATINRLRRDAGYTIDTHGAVAYAATSEVSTKVPKVVFATGHPAKHIDIMTRVTGSSIELPIQLTHFMTVRRHSIIIPPTLPALRKQLLTL